MPSGVLQHAARRCSLPEASGRHLHHERQLSPGSHGRYRAQSHHVWFRRCHLEFYNMQHGDAPYLRHLADTYTMSDNYHQAAMGGTGLNHIMFGFADAIWYSDGNGNPQTPIHAQIEDPDAQPGTNNWYVEDGYGGYDSKTGPYGGGSYSACADTTQPGVPAVVN